MIVDSVEQLIGNTPILRLRFNNNAAELFLKLEMLNPSGSMKDRMASKIISSIESDFGIDGEFSLVESSSGNTATSLAMISALKNKKFTAIMDGHASKEKVLAVRAFGAEVEFVFAADGQLATSSRDEEAERRSQNDDRTVWTMQHNNPNNSIGYLGMADELICDLGNEIHTLIGSIGTGGSLCGTSRYLKSKIPSLITVAVEPQGSVIFGGPGHNYLQSGTGTPEGAEIGLVIDYDCLDSALRVGDKEAFCVCRQFARRFGILIGGSAGGVVFEALRYCIDGEGKGKRVVAIVADSGMKYLTSIYDDTWIQSHVGNITTELDYVHSLFQHIL
jgi:cystathionine beta-synthase